MANEKEERTAPIEQGNADDEILFEHILAEVRAVNSKDRTRFLIDTVNDEIKDLMQSINKYGKDGQIKITLKFGCAQANEMNLTAEVETKKPKGSATGTQMFRDLKGKLYMDDPNQMKLLDSGRVHSIGRK